MEKTISSLMIFCFLIHFFSVNPSVLNIQETIEKSKTDSNFQNSVYMISMKQKNRTMENQNFTVTNNSNPELLWKNLNDVGISLGTPIFTTDVNEDGVPDILVNHSILDGKTGILQWHTTTGEVCGIGDINNDEKDEIFTRDLLGSPDSYLYCLYSNGTVIWQIYFNCSLIEDTVSVGNLIGNSTNEVIVPTGDWIYHHNRNLYCLDGTSGNVIWKKAFTQDVICAKISDVNNDGKNEVLASINNQRGFYCLDGNGDSVWEIHPPHDLDYRIICTGDLNQDSYKEIVLESKNESWLFGARCISGKDGSTLWTWYQDWDDNKSGSFQSIQIADVIPSFPGNEVIVGGVCGLYCLRGGDNVSSDKREIWHAGIANHILPDIVMSADVGDLDTDGYSDIVALTDSTSGVSNGVVYAIDGQSGIALWTYQSCGSDTFHGIITTDLTGDGYPEVIAKDDSYVCALKSNSLPNFQRSWLVGIIKNVNIGMYYSYFNASCIISLSVKPLNFSVYHVGEKFMVLNTYLGKIRPHFIFGRFDTILVLKEGTQLR